MSKVFRRGVIISFYAITCFTLATLLLFFAFVLYKGLHALSLNLLFDSVPVWDALLGKKRVFDGIFNAIIGSFYVVILASIIALPLGLLSGIYLGTFASPKVRGILGFVYELLSSMPSIVIGLFGLSVTIYLHKNFFDQLFPSLLISALSLAVLIMPYAIKTTQSALQTIPLRIHQIGLNLGATTLQNLFLVELPFVSKELLGGVILSMGRAVEDTAVIMMTGAVAMAGIPSSLLQKYEALPFLIYHVSLEYTNQAELSSGFGAAILLLGVSLFLFSVATVLRKWVAKRSGFNG